MQTKLAKIAVLTSLLYAGIAGLWILLSDRLLVNIVSDPATIGRLSMYKGWFFVAVTAVLLYAMLRGQLRRWEKEAASRMAAEEAVRLAGAYNRSLIEASLDPLVTIDKEGKINDVNAATEKVTGYGRSELIGTDFSNYFTEPEKTLAGYQQAFDQGFVCDYELEIRNRNGEITPVLYNASVYRDDTGNVIGFFAATRDITERKRGEETRSRLAAIVESSYDGIISKDLDGTITSWNQGAERLYGYSASEALGRLITILMPPGQQDEFAAFMRQIREGVRIEHYETQRIRKDGQLIDVSLTVSPIRDRRGEIIGASAIARDISAQKRAEEERRQSAERFRAIADYTYDWENWIGVDGKLLWVNPAVERITGYSVGECMVMPDYPISIIAEADRETVARQIREAVQGSSRNDFEFRVRHKDGHLVWVAASWQPIYDSRGARLGHRSSIRHITDRKRAEETMRESEANLNRAQEVAHIGSWHLDIARNRLVWSDEVFRIFGVPLGTALTYEAFLDMVHPGDLESVHKAWSAALHGAPYDIEHRIVVGGELKWVRERAHVEFSKEGNATSGIGTVQDITELKRAEKALRERADLLDLTHDAVFVMDMEGVIKYWNRGAEERYHWSAEQAVGRVAHDLLKTVFPAPHEQIKAELMRTARWEGELVHTRKDGTQLVVASRWALQRQEKGAPVAILETNNDITERKQAQEAIEKLLAELELRVEERTKELSEANDSLQAANKELESFSYSVSHDLRAPLRAIDGFSMMVLKEYAEKLDDEGRRKLNVIRSNAQTMGRLIDDLLAFSRLGRKELANASLDMEALVRGAWTELTVINPGRRIQFSVNTLPPAMGDQTLIKEVVVNLLANAIKFTKPRETATIEVGSYTEEQTNVYFVKDNGVGFDMEYYDKLFGVFQRLHSSDEFEGTGVGLAIVERIIGRHGGRVWAHGKEDKGATFYFALPRKE